MSRLALVAYSVFVFTLLYGTVIGDAILKEETDSFGVIKQNICYSFGEKPGKALIEQIEKNPFRYLSDERPVVAEYAKQLSQSPRVQLEMIAKLQERLDAIESGRNEEPVDVSLGTFRYSPKLEFVLPDEIPENAKKVLLYIQFESGTSSHDVYPQITISVTASSGKVYTHRFKVHTYDQNAWSYNSDNVWMPMPKDRIITVTQTQAYSGNAAGSLRILRYTV